MLEKLFTSKTRIKLLHLFIFSKDSFHLREIERKIKTPVSAVKREIENLQKIGLIKKQKNLYSLDKECQILQELKNILLKTDSLTSELSRHLKKLKIKFAFVFGSFAEDIYTPASDIDLFVIGDIRTTELVKILKSAEKKLDREINPVVWTLPELKRKSKISFIKDIMKKKIVMIHGNENELRRIIEAG